MQENQGRLLDSTSLSPAQTLACLRHLLQTDIDNPPLHGVS